MWHISNGTASSRAIIIKIATFRPLIALVIALLLSGVDYPPWLSGLFKRLGDTLAPLVLVSVGVQLRLDQLAGNRATLRLGLAFKLVMGSLILALLYIGVLHRTGEATRITMFEAATGPQIGGASSSSCLEMEQRLSRRATSLAGRMPKAPRASVGILPGSGRSHLRPLQPFVREQGALQTGR